MGLSEKVQSLVDQWLAWDFNPETRAEIEKLVNEGNEKELEQILGKRIAFGTAGLRGVMRAGFANMNTLTVLQASQGYCKYLQSTFADVKERGVIVGYDGRHNSKEFAIIAASVFVSQGIKVFLFSTKVPTPYVSYGCIRCNTVGGVMVTASHNPKADNGYKVYYGTSAQINTPVDAHIAQSIVDNLKPWDFDHELCLKSDLCVDPLADVRDSYNKLIVEKLCYYKEANASAKPIVYTAMHGVGAEAVRDAFKAFNLPPYVPVKEQIFPDPDFSTVSYPNPEEGKGALTLAIATAEKHNIDLILANDPDADRLAVAERTPQGEWHIFNGNELGNILGYWMWEHRHRYSPNTPDDKFLLINTAVSSRMYSGIAKHFGAQYEETLTGFKYMGNKSMERSKDGLVTLIAYEEAIGYMPGNICLDKDGVRTAAIFTEMYGQLQAKNMTVADYLESIYEKFGYYCITTNYFKCYPVVMKDIFDKVRAAYPKSLGSFTVSGVRDLTTGYDSSTSDNKPLLPTSTTQMITFAFTNGAIATIRGSGTEPKLKYYVEVPGAAGEAKESVIAKHAELRQAVVDVLLKPEENKLEAPAQ